MTIALLMLLLAGAPATATPAAPPARVVPPPALTDAEVQGQLTAYLYSIDTPISAAKWQALGPRAVPMLEQISSDEGKLPTHRAKAVEALVAIAPPAATAHLTELARNPAIEPLVRWSALRGLGALVPPEQLLGVLDPALQDTDFRMRAVAVEVLSVRAPAQACAIVQAKAAAESTHRAAFSRAAERCGAARAR